MGHAAHTDPELSEYFPVLHKEHDALEVNRMAVEYVPGGHPRQEEDPDTEYVPAVKQSIQTLMLVAPIIELYFPAGQ